MEQYDYIILGAGAAGLLLANAMGEDAFFKDKAVLILEKDAKKTNDRTWCYWEKGSGALDKIIHRSWEHINFIGPAFQKRAPITPYTYKMIRGLDFYDESRRRLKSHPNITYKQEQVSGLSETKKGVVVATARASYSAHKVFNSIFSFDILRKQTKYPVLQQHFVGWFIKTKLPIFDPDAVTFMDFSIPQNGNTRFMYVLPFSHSEALVEYTLFSKNRLREQEYEIAIKEYLLEKYRCEDYTIIEKEQGVIPMTCYNFSEHNSKAVFHIGTAGGWAKPSTGYTFFNSFNKVQSLIQHLKKGSTPKALDKKDRFWYYDLLLLDILHHDNALGSTIFEALFRRRPPQLILKFLNGDTSLWEDLKIISACPKRLFLKALLRRLF